MFSPPSHYGITEKEVSRDTERDDADGRHLPRSDPNGHAHFFQTRTKTTVFIVAALLFACYQSYLSFSGSSSGIGSSSSLFGLQFSTENNEDEDETTKANSLVFIRIPKTGSTSFMKFLMQFSMMESFYTSISHKDDSYRIRAQSCMFGPMIHGQNVANDYKENTCTHYPYPTLMKAWKKTVPQWTKRRHLDHLADSNLRMEVVTMVRDPFDRFRSYFDYLYDGVDHERWRRENTEAQYERVQAGDFAGWLELLYTENSIPHGAQYGYVDEDVDEAIATITGDDPDVLVLVNECYEGSIKLMERKVSIDPYAGGAFLGSSRSHSNPSDKTVTEAINYDELRKMSREYFPEEYEFYNAAVQQFARQLNAAGLGHYCPDL